MTWNLRSEAVFLHMQGEFITLFILQNLETYKKSMFVLSQICYKYSRTDPEVRPRLGRLGNKAGCSLHTRSLRQDKKTVKVCEGPEYGIRMVKAFFG